MANFTALATARHHLLQQAGWDVEQPRLFERAAEFVAAQRGSDRAVADARQILTRVLRDAAGE